MPAPSVHSLIRGFYLDYLSRQDSASFVRRIAENYTISTLVALLDRGSREDRRAATLALGMVGDSRAVQPLGRALQDPDRLVRTLAEHGCRMIWRRPDNAADRQRLQAILRANRGGRHEDAIELASAFIRDLPQLAEVWNQRAIAWYGLKLFRASLDDCRRAIGLNGYHFDAWSGSAQCHLHLGDEPAALDALQTALRVNPQLEGVRVGVEYLRRRLRSH